jgi:hypothetical protein
VAVGFVIGPVVGGLLGLALGSIVFDAGTGGMWGSVVAGIVFGVLLGGFWAGMSALGPPAPEDDPLPREDDEDADRGSGHSRTV